MALFVYPLDPSEFSVTFSPSQLLGWKTSDFKNVDTVVREYIKEIRVDELIASLNKRTECDLIILE